MAKLSILKDPRKPTLLLRQRGVRAGAGHPRGGEAALRPGREGRPGRQQAGLLWWGRHWHGRHRPITRDLYAADQTRGLPEAALLASFGCGNPTALAELQPGEIVLDLGSGGGIDVLLSGKRVGPTGKAYGLDMTDEMLVLAEQNKAKAGAANVEFLKGNIEDIPLPDNAVDVIISNCVINPVGRQGQGSTRGLPRAQVGWALRRLRHRASPPLARGRQ